MRIVKWRIIFSELRITVTALLSAGHLENDQPGTAAEVIYKSLKSIQLFICARSAGPACRQAGIQLIVVVLMRIYSSPPADAKLNDGCSQVNVGYELILFRK